MATMTDRKTVSLVDWATWATDTQKATLRIAARLAYAMPSDYRTDDPDALRRHVCWIRLCGRDWARVKTAINLAYSHCGANPPELIGHGDEWDRGEHPLQLAARAIDPRFW